MACSSSLAPLASFSCCRGRSTAGHKIGTRLPIWNVQIESVGMGLMRRNQGSSAFGARLRTRIGSFLPALVAFAATPCDDIGQIIAAVIVGNLGACSDVPDGAYDDLVAYRVDLGIGPARMICVTSKVLSARSVDRPTAVDLEEIAVASGLKFIGLLGRKLAAFVFDNESSLLDRRCRKKTQARAGTADTESSVGGHIRHVRRFAPVQPHRGGSAIDLSAITCWCARAQNLMKPRHPLPASPRSPPTVAAR